MGKEKEKPYKGIFIDFANSKFEREDIFDLIDKLFNYFPTSKIFWKESLPCSDLAAVCRSNDIFFRENFLHCS